MTKTTALEHLIHGTIPFKVEDGESVGEWFRTYHGQTIVNIDTPAGQLKFDPPNILFLYGHRIRIRRFDTEHPVLDVELFTGEIRTYLLVLEAPTS